VLHVIDGESDPLEECQSLLLVEIQVVEDDGKSRQATASRCTWCAERPSLRSSMKRYRPPDRKDLAMSRAPALQVASTMLMSARMLVTTSNSFTYARVQDVGLRVRRLGWALSRLAR